MCSLPDAVRGVAWGHPGQGSQNGLRSVREGAGVRPAMCIGRSQDCSQSALNRWPREPEAWEAGNLCWLPGCE